MMEFDHHTWTVIKHDQQRTDAQGRSRNEAIETRIMDDQLTLRRRQPAHVDFRCLVFDLRSKKSAISLIALLASHAARGIVALATES